MAETFWGGRFTKEIDKDFLKFQSSLNFDYQLAVYDICHSMIHVRALEKAKFLVKAESIELLAALVDILNEVKQEGWKPDSDAEDIHTYIQNQIEEKVKKETALKLHSFRSRNDQIAFDEQNYCLFQAVDINYLLVHGVVVESLLSLKDRYKNNYFIGYTHTQRAQVIKFGDYIQSFADMFMRDCDRLSNFINNLEIFIGSGAVAGSYIKKEYYGEAIKEFIKEKLKDITSFKISLTKNPLDNVSNRDFIIEFLSILSILQLHLSRFAEDCILYSTKEFNFINLPEEFCTGSSLMPHKKNPDFLELVRGYTGRIYGNLISVLTTMKGLPMTYNRDMQLDKEPLFSSVEIIKDELKILPKFINGIKLNTRVIEKIIKEEESLFATELAEYLVEKGEPFKKAHDIVGNLIKESEKTGRKIKQMENRLLKTFSPHLSKSVVKKVLTPKYAIKSKRSIASENIKEIAQEILRKQQAEFNSPSP